MSANPPLQTLDAFFEWCIETTHEDKGTADLLRNLHHDKIPTESNFSADSIQAIKVALRSLVILEQSVMELEGSRAEIATLIQDVWSDHLWGWLEFLHTHCVIEHSLGETLMLASLRLIPRTLAYFSWHLGLRKSVIRTPGCLVMLVRHWVEEETYVNKPQMAWDLRYFALALDQLLCYDKKEDKEVLDIIEVAVEGGRDAVARIALTQLSAQLQDIMERRDKVIMVDVINFNLIMIDFLASSSPATLRSLLCQGLMLTITRFLNTLDREPDSEFLHNCIVSVFSIISAVLFSANGHSWISQCLEAGLIRGILCAEQCLFALGPEFPPAISGSVFRRLQQYLVYRSVLRTVEKVLKDVKGMEDGRDVSGPMWKDFFAFRETALQRLSVKTMFDKGSHSGLGCDNCLCPKTTDSVEFKCCAACLSAFYCGRSCQKAHWTQHRTICKKLQKALAQGDCIPLSTHDTRFLPYLSAVDLRLNTPLLVDCIRKKYASTPLSSLYVNLDYTRVPHGLSVHPSSSYPWMDEDEKLQMENILHSLDKRQVVVRVTFRAGDIVRRFLMLFSIPAGTH